MQIFMFGSASEEPEQKEGASLREPQGSVPGTGGPAACLLGLVHLGAEGQGDFWEFLALQSSRKHGFRPEGRREFWIPGEEGEGERELSGRLF